MLVTGINPRIRNIESPESTKIRFKNQYVHHINRLKKYHMVVSVNTETTLADSY